MIVLCALWSGAARAQDHCTDLPIAPGAATASAAGTIGPDATACYTIRPPAGQVAHLVVSGANAVVAVADMGHARSDWTFTTKARAYTLTVAQKARSDMAQPFALTLTLSPRPHCSLSRMDLCAYGNSLVNDPDFRAEIVQFLGNRRGIYTADRPLADQVIGVLSGPADAMQPLGPFYSFAVCNNPTCNDKGMAVVDSDGQIVALGIIHGTCIRHLPDCMGDRRLTVFIRGVEEHRAVINQMTQWAHDAAAQTMMVAGPMPSLRGVNVVPVD